MTAKSSLKKLVCPNCGTENREDIEFCIKCRLSVELFEHIAMKKGKEIILCSNCGKVLTREKRFCDYCGEDAIAEDVSLEKKEEENKALRIIKIVGIVLGLLAIFPIVLVFLIFKFSFNSIGKQAFTTLDEAEETVKDPLLLDNRSRLRRIFKRVERRID